MLIERTKDSRGIRCRSGLLACFCLMPAYKVIFQRTGSEAYYLETIYNKHEPRFLYSYNLKLAQIDLS